MDAKTLQEMIERANELSYDIQNLSIDQLIELEELDQLIEAHNAPLRAEKASK